ncbi:T9SS type A sorting domain-containing protein [Aequorivita antarctica]|uniref:T9SS type A sorting domain-containing protein n=1 Tax=Aequorivita antarctica TaxID=153266 RepID=A0A5C6YZX3_9FLAO|nr:T9SS type A sorting domain-containing protein [Aequorivita antarctica]TXD73254.1 T9SS type A sorting domain-containing protein [Aequorivita antarctica]SRX76007.1 hypothetical protein AEQU3_03005 [Aequorivita antarctica]
MKNVALFIFLSLVVLNNTLKAQNFQKAYGYSEDQQELYDLILDQNNNSFTCGVYRNVFLFPERNFFGTVNKIDTDGNLLWNKAYLPTDAVSLDGFFLYSIIQDSQNYIYAIGVYLGGPNRDGYYLLKINDQGEVIWAKFLNEEIQLLSDLLYANNAIYAVLQDRIVKFSLDGEVLEAVKINLGFDILLRKGLALSNGNIVVTGESLLNNNHNAPVITFDQNLSPVSSYTYYRDTQNAIYGTSLAEAADSYLIIGLSDSSVLSIDQNTGEILWVKSFITKETPSSSDSLNFVEQIVATSNLNNNFFVAINGSYFDQNTNQLYIALTEIDSQGNVSDIKAIKKVPFNSIDTYLSVSTLALNNTGSYYLSGRLVAVQNGTSHHLNYYHKGTIDELGCGEETINFEIADTKSSLLKDIFPANLIIPTTQAVSSKQFNVLDILTDYDNKYCIDPILSVEDLETSVEIYPNPTQNILNIVSQQSIVEVKIFDVLGKDVGNLNISNNQIDVSQLNQGLYFLNIKFDNNKLNISKFIKQ